MPTEAHNSVGLVERYHGQVRRAYQIAQQEIPQLSKEMALQMAFKAVNDTAGPDGLVPTLLVYGAYPRLSSISAPSPSITQRAAAIQKAMKEVQKIKAERHIADALNMRNGPSTTAVHKLSIGDQVLTWREMTTFIGECRRRRLDDKYLSSALVAMMADQARLVILDLLAVHGDNWRRIAREMANRFEGRDQQHARITAWGTMSMQSFLATNERHGQPLSVSARAYFLELQKTQNSLPKAMRNSQTLRDKYLRGLIAYPQTRLVAAIIGGQEYCTPAQLSQKLFSVLSLSESAGAETLSLLAQATSALYASGSCQ